jgi:hypothetical protein
MKNSFYQQRLLLALSGFFLAFLFTPVFANAATFYVSTTGNDNNAGTQTAPCEY